MQYLCAVASSCYVVENTLQSQVIYTYITYIYKDPISGVEGDLKVEFVCAENFKVIPQTISDETKVHISLTLCHLK